MRVYNEKIASGVVLNANYNSPAAPLKSTVMYSISAVITGTPNGIIKLQASNDPETNDTQPGGVPFPTPTNWVDITNTPFTVTTAGESMWNVRNPAYNYVRVAYVDNSGGSSTATVSIIINSKGV